MFKDMKQALIENIVIVLLAIFLVGPVCDPVLADDEALQIISESAVLMDAKTGQVLYEKNMHEKLYPASITKILTILLAIEKGNLSDTVTMSREAVFSVPRWTSHIALDEGEQITVEQALMAAILPSANDACNGIAEHIGGSISSFTQLMNQRAREAGALNSSFVNPHGLPDDMQLTTAYDMAMITRAALQNNRFKELIGTVRYTIPPTNKQPECRDLWSEHRMLTTNRFYYQGVIGGKTGYTRESQNTLVTAARRGDRELIAVVMRSEDFGVYKDTITLFDYGFNQFVETSIPLTAPNVDTAHDQDETQAIQCILDQNQGISIKRLLHKNINPEAIACDYNLMENSENKEACLITNIHINNANKLMYYDLGSVNLYGTLLSTDRWAWTSTLFKVVKIIISIVAGVFALLFIARCFFKTRRKIKSSKSRSRVYRLPR